MSGLWDLATFEQRSGAMTPGETLPELFLNAVQARGDAVWMREKKLGIWREWRWREAAVAVREIAMGLAALGLQPGQTASILANTVVEWVLVDVGILCAGGVTNGIYPTDSEQQVVYLCADSATRIVFVEDEEQLDKLLEVRQQLPLLQHIVVFDMKGLGQFEDAQVRSLAALRELGRAFDAAHPGEYERRCRSRGPEDLAILVYTSGTTGRPKGAMHLHGGIIWTLRRIGVHLPQMQGDERMCFLPLCHIAERMIGAYSSIGAGSILNFVENPDTVAENVREIAPTIFFAVPRVWEKFYSAVTIGVKEAGRVQQLAYAWAIGVGGRIAERVLARRPVPWLLRWQFRVARFLALDNVRKIVGIHRARYLITGAAPISPDLVRWFMALGVPMLEGWGMTETCAIGTINRADAIKAGTIGPPMEGIEARIDPDSGEIQLRGRNVFAGYLNQPEKTAEAIDAEGWLHTGDVGAVDEEGYFRITDRMKDIIITAGGKNVTPSEWENELKFSPYITDAVVVGDKRPYLVCIVMIDQENVERFAQEHDVPFSNYASLARAPEVLALIQREIDKVNAKFARVEQVKRFWLLDLQLGAEDEELTPTMKLKRKLVEKKYASQIEAMYPA
ncbi:MAG: fatty-acid--CoA ligase [Rubrivivax sp. SCN 71-131]|jgi:long-chain acyl-CoA synthetase|nr:MAG: fatty-acid--CoA ligase [Rubrivivax sp. SCN 71-131]